MLHCQKLRASFGFRPITQALSTVYNNIKAYLPSLTHYFLVQSNCIMLQIPASAVSCLYLLSCPTALRCHCQKELIFSIIAPTVHALTATTGCCNTFTFTVTYKLQSCWEHMSSKWQSITSTKTVTYHYALQLSMRLNPKLGIHFTIQYHATNKI